MAQTGRRARIAHAIRGRLRVRFDGDVPGSSLDALAAVRLTPGVTVVDVRLSTRSIVVHYDPAVLTQVAVVAELGQAGVMVIDSRATSPSTRRSAPEGASAPRADGPADPDRPTGGSTLRELLIGPPPKLDRRFAESLALSGVSLVAARQVGLALGGGMMLPAYFAIWFALRRLTGAGRRR